MAWMQVDFYSGVLGLTCTMNVIVPQKPADGNGDPSDIAWPVLYLLHGGSDNHANWLLHTSVVRYALRRNLAVVMPATQYSFYSDQKYGYDWFRFIADELPAIVRQLFRVSGRREDTFAAGLSMGGYGAFKLGIVHPDRYAAVASLSGSLDQRDRLTDRPAISNAVMLRMARHTFGSVGEYERSVNDLAWMLERRLAEGAALPRFYQACGTLDHNYEINAAFSRRFGGRIDLTVVESPGRGHDWAYWDEQIERVIDWLPLREP